MQLKHFVSLENLYACGNKLKPISSDNVLLAISTSNYYDKDGCAIITIIA